MGLPTVDCCLIATPVYDYQLGGCLLFRFNTSQRWSEKRIRLRLDLRSDIAAPLQAARPDWVQTPFLLDSRIKSVG